MTHQQKLNKKKPEWLQERVQFLDSSEAWYRVTVAYCGEDLGDTLGEVAGEVAGECLGEFRGEKGWARERRLAICLIITCCKGGICSSWLIE